MIKRRLFSTLTVFLFVFIFVTFLVPSDLNAETRKFWVDEGYYEDQDFWVTGGYFKDTQEKRWVDTSYKVTQGYWENYTINVWVSSGYTASRWVDTSHYVWVSSGYTASRWVDTSHYETRYRTVTGWVPCNKTFVYQNLPSEPKNVILSKWVDYRDTKYTGIINGTRYKYWKSLYYVLPANNIGQVGAWVIFKTKYNCFEMEVTYTESYSVWVSSGYTAYYWVDTSHNVWVSSGYSQSYWVDTSHWETQTGKRWVDTSYTVTQGYWEYYTTRTWVDTSHWETRDVWVEDGYWVEAELDPDGKVLHTEKWNENRINYNLSKTGDPDKPRGYEVFFNGEKFVLEADTPGDFQPYSVHVEFLGTVFETDLTNTGDSKWEGYIWDDSFIYFHDRDCVFKFTASYDYNGEKFKIEDEVTVYIVRNYYWQLHRLF